MGLPPSPSAVDSYPTTMALSATLSTLKDRLQLFSSEADTLTAICNSTVKARSAAWSSPIVSNSPYNMRPPSARPKLPTEILDNVFSHLKKVHLEPLLIANSYISSVATRRLYHDVALVRPAAIVAFLRAILANDRLPTLVRCLDINMTKSRETPKGHTKARPTGNFYLLLQRALRAMHALTSLYIELPKAHTPLWIFEGCKFRLRQFTTSMYCRRPLAHFLETQGSIEELTLRGYQTDAVMFLPFIDHVNGPLAIPADEVFVLSASALPQLHVFNAVHADASLIRAVVKGRPVSVVSVPLFPEMSVASLDALCASSVPLKRLSVISFDPTAPGFMFEALARRFVDLEALHLVMLMAEYNQELLEQSGAVLASFRCLRYITFMAAPSRPIPTPAPALAAIASSSSTGSSSSTPTTSTDTDDSNDLDPGEADIAKQWHHHCPTLRTIILPKGRVWFQNGPDGAGSTLPLSVPATAASAPDAAAALEPLGSAATSWEAGETSGVGVTPEVDMPTLAFSIEDSVQDVPQAAATASDTDMPGVPDDGSGNRSTEAAWSVL